MAAKEEIVFNNTPTNKTQLLSFHPISDCNYSAIQSLLSDTCTQMIMQQQQFVFIRLFLSERAYSGLMAQLEAVVYNEASTV